MRVHAFPMSISLKVNVITQVEFELAYYEAAAIHLSLYAPISSCRAASTDIPDPLSSLLPIIHRLQHVSGLHPVSSHSCCMYVRAGPHAFARPYVGIHRSTSLMSSSLLLQQCPACLAHLTWIVFVVGGRWLYSWCLVGCCRQDLFNIARKRHNYLYIAINRNHYI